MRCLVVETEGRKILIDAGLGTKQDEKFLVFITSMAVTLLKDLFICQD